MKHKKGKKNGKENAEKQGSFFIRYLVILIMILCIALVYVWQHVQLVNTGYLIKKLDKQLENIQEENELLRLRSLQLKSPGNIERLLFSNQLRLVLPHSNQIVYLDEPQKEVQKDLVQRVRAGGTVWDIREIVINSKFLPLPFIPLGTLFTSDDNLS